MEKNYCSDQGDFQAGGQCRPFNSHGEEVSLPDGADTRYPERFGQGSLCSRAGQVQRASGAGCGHRLQIHWDTPSPAFERAHKRNCDMTEIMPHSEKPYELVLLNAPSGSASWLNYTK